MTMREHELQRIWTALAARPVQYIVFGIGTIRIMGKAGNAPVTFQHIVSLDLPLDLEQSWRLAEGTFSSFPSLDDPKQTLCTSRYLF